MAKRGTARRRPKQKSDRLDSLINLQKRAVDRWSRYTVNAARLTAKGSASPKDWMEQYTQLTRGVFEDVGDFVRLVFSRANR